MALSACGSYQQAVDCAALFEALRDASRASGATGDLREVNRLRALALRDAVRKGESAGKLAVDLAAARKVTARKPLSKPGSADDRAFYSCWNRYQ
ncbi:MAG: hypothetical protein ACXW27_05305 [Allosphingosinicella sp.]